MSDDNQSFSYSYSAKEQEEIKKIRERYTSQPESRESKMEQLRALDASVTKKGTTAALIAGILGALIMGSGMSLVMTDLGKDLGIPYPLGIAIGVLGMVGVALAYPIYNHITKKERQRIAPEILRLTDELMQ